MASAAALLLRVDGAGLMLADQAFERLRRRARARSRRIDDVAREVIANRPRRSSG